MTVLIVNFESDDTIFRSNLSISLQLWQPNPTFSYSSFWLGVKLFVVITNCTKNWCQIKLIV
jgi:hypothetical protein